MHRQNSQAKSTQHSTASMQKSFTHSRFYLPRAATSLLFVFQKTDFLCCRRRRRRRCRIAFSIHFQTSKRFRFVSFYPNSENRVLKNGQKPMLICLPVCLFVGYLKLCMQNNNNNNNSNIEDDNDDSSYDNDNEK